MNNLAIINNSSLKIELYSLCVILLTLKVLFDGTLIFNLPNIIDTLFLSVICILLGVNYFLKKYKIKQFYKIIIISIFVLYSSFKTNYYVILIAWLIIIGLKESNLKKNIYLIFKTQVIFVLLNCFISIILYLIGFSNDLFITVRRGEEFFNFGFNHVNTFSIIVSNIIFIWIWLNYNKLKKIHLSLLLLIFIILFLITDTRTSFFIQLITLFLVYLSKANMFEGGIRYIAKILFPLLGVGMLVLSHLYYSDNIIAMFFNKILTGRIHFSSYALHNFGFTLFGEERFFNLVTWDPFWKLNGFTFDNLYAQLFFHLGVFWFGLISYCIYKVVNKIDYISVIMLISWCLYGVTETQILYGILGYQLFFLALLFQNREA